MSRFVPQRPEAFYRQLFNVSVVASTIAPRITVDGLPPVCVQVAAFLGKRFASPTESCSPG